MIFHAELVINVVYPEPLKRTQMKHERYYAIIADRAPNERTALEEFCLDPPNRKPERIRSPPSLLLVVAYYTGVTSRRYRETL